MGNSSTEAISYWTITSLPCYLEDLRPILDQLIESLLRRAFVGDDVVMHPLLHVEEELGVQDG